MIIELSDDGWEKELEDESISSQTKKILSSMIKAMRNKTKPPKVTPEQLLIIENEVFFVRFLTSGKGYLVSYNKSERTLRLKFDGIEQTMEDL